MPKWGKWPRAMIPMNQPVQKREKGNIILDGTRKRQIDVLKLQERPIPAKSRRAFKNRKKGQAEQQN